MCKHNFQYSQGRFQCLKCGKIASEKQFKRNHNKSYATIVIIGLVIIGGIYAYANYETTIMNFIPSVDTEEIFKGVEELGKISEKEIQEISNEILVKNESELTEPVTEPITIDRCSDFSPGADLSGCNLQGMDFHNAHFYNTNLSDANLVGTSFFHADLRNVDFRNADLTNADLRYTNLNGADMRGANLDGTKLDNALLSGTKFQ
jgi:hypothetical protein